MNAKQRVLTACQFKRPDRIPRFDSFWELPAGWEARLGSLSALSDVAIWYPDETPFPTQARQVKQEEGYWYEIDGWGRLVRRRPGAYFVETLESPLADVVQLDRISFDSPGLDERYLTGKADPSTRFPNQSVMQQTLAEDKARHCVFAKTGGPFLRSTYVRGEEQFLMDLAADQGLARAIADKMARHLAAVGVEQLRRWDLYDTGIWIYDDMACNQGPMFSPRQFEEALLPAYRYMIDTYKQAGARYVILHSDGDIRLLLDMLVDAGIDGINPLERRANMDIVALRQRYPNLILIGGMCNTHTLIHGSEAEIRAEAREIIDLGRDGGVVIGTHSISPEIPLEKFMAYHETCLSYGTFSGDGERHDLTAAKQAGE